MLAANRTARRPTSRRALETDPGVHSDWPPRCPKLALNAIHHNHLVANHPLVVRFVPQPY